MSEHTIKFENGVMEFVYSDDLQPLLTEGEATVTRASHVEPYAGGWAADMRPSFGGVIGSNGEAFGLRDNRWYIDDVPLVPFTLREDALAAERAWLRKEKGL